MSYHHVHQDPYPPLGYAPPVPGGYPYAVPPTGYVGYPPPPPPPRPGPPGYQGYFNEAEGYPPPPPQHVQHQHYEYQYDSGCSSFLRGCLAALCCCCVLEECCCCF